MIPDENGVVARLFGPQRGTQEMLALPGVWASSEDLERDATEAGSRPATFRLQYLRRVDPGAPLPDGVEPGAARYEAVVHTEVPERWRRPAALAGAVLALGSAGILAAGVPWGILTLLGAVALIASGVTGGLEWVTFRQVENGGWVEAEAELPPAEPLPQFATWERVLYGTLAAAFVGMMLTGRIEGNLLLVATVSAGLAAAAVWDSLPIRRRDRNNALVAGHRFRELADPARPLTPAHARRPGPHRRRRPAGAPRDARRGSGLSPLTWSAENLTPLQPAGNLRAGLSPIPRPA